MAGGEAEHPLGNGLPLWAQMMKWNDPDAAQEAVALGASSNLRDHRGRGWLWWGCETKMPASLILSALPTLNGQWWHPDHEGFTPFHHPDINPSVAHAMACRWWADGLSWQLLCKHGNPLDTARANQRWDLVSIWQGPHSLPWFTRP